MSSGWAFLNLAQFAILGSSCILAALALSIWLEIAVKKDGALKKSRNFKFTVLSLYSSLKSRLATSSFLKLNSMSWCRSRGAPFTVDTPNNTIVLVSDWGRIKEIDAAPEGTLSLLAAARDILQPRHTMDGFAWSDRRGSDGAPLQMTMRSRLTSHLPVLLPKIRHNLHALLDQRLDTLPVAEDAQNQSFLRAGIKMVEHTVIIAEILRMVPGLFSNYLGNYLSSRLDSGKVMTEALTSEVSRRFQNRELRKQGLEIPEQNDCIEWIMDHSPRHKPWGVTRVVNELIAVWFGSVHIASTTACAAMFDLCDNPDFVDILREEIRHTGWQGFDQSGGQILPLMDSFLKESARLNPIESVSTRRKVLKPFKFSDGMTVQPGNWICSAARGMNRNPNTWAKADEFYIFRFVKPEVLEQAEKYIEGLSSDKFKIPEAGKTSAYTDVSGWQQWGTGKGSCTGRWYASAAIKTILGVLITRYDIKLVDPTAKRYFSWRTFIYPYESTQVTIKKRHEIGSHVLR
ncbi:putative cytochrome P450 [Nemania abortiva]|nr:putative cytochrome P450 [Nemania abortiva]